ncbi:MAG: extracellular solute-binding protein [Chloroflexota bacterium]
MTQLFLSVRLNARNAFLTILAIVITLMANGCGREREEAPIASPPTEAQANQIPNSQDNSNSEEGATNKANETAQSESGTTSLSLEGTVVIWHSWTGAEADAFNEILGRTQTDHANLIIDTLFVAYSDLEESYIDAVSSGGGPDLLLAPNWWLPNLIQGQSIAPLIDLMPTEELTRYWPAAVENLAVGGTPYGVPATVEVVSLYYNQSRVAPGALPKTTDELLSLVRTNGSPGLGLYNSFYHLQWGLSAFGTQLLDGSGKAILDQSPGTVQYLLWLIQLDESPGVYIDTDYGMLVERFKKGEYAFFVDGPWSLSELKEALGDQLQVALLPAGPIGQARPWLTSEGFFVNPNKGKDTQGLAAQVALELTDGESGQLFLQIARLLPATRGVQGPDPLLNGFMAQAEQAESMPSIPEIQQALGYGGDMLIKALNGVADPQEIVAETTALINEANNR